MAEERIGVITHYFAKPEVGVIKLEAPLSVGDTLHFKGATTDFEQKVNSMQIEHDPVEQAEPGSEVAVKVGQRVRGGDDVYRVTAD